MKYIMCLIIVSNLNATPPESLKKILESPTSPTRVLTLEDIEKRVNPSSPGFPSSGLFRRVLWGGDSKIVRTPEVRSFKTPSGKVISYIKRPSTLTPLVEGVEHLQVEDKSVQNPKNLCSLLETIALRQIQDTVPMKSSEKK